MEDIGLEDYMLPPDEPQRLPDLVETVLVAARILPRICEVFERGYTRNRSRRLAEARQRIERVDSVTDVPVAKVSIVVVKSGNDEKDNERSPRVLRKPTKTWRCSFPPGLAPHPAHAPAALGPNEVDGRPSSLALKWHSPKQSQNQPVST